MSRDIFYSVAHRLCLVNCNVPIKSNVTTEAALCCKDKSNVPEEIVVFC